MCKFYSAILMKNGDLKHNPWTSSHEDIIDQFGIKDNGRENFIRVEFIPQNNNYIDVDNYVFNVDENSIPEWFTDELRETTVYKLKLIINSMIIKEDRLIVCGEPIILHNCKIKKLKHSLVYSMSGSSVVESMSDSSVVKYMSDSSVVKSMYGSSVVKYKKQ